MLNNQQIIEIYEEIARLEHNKEEIRKTTNSQNLKLAIEDYTNGRIDGLKWAKENL